MTLKKLFFSVILLFGFISLRGQNGIKRCRFDYFDHDYVILFEDCAKRKIVAQVRLLKVNMQSNYSLKVYIHGRRLGNGDYEFYFSHGRFKTKKFKESELDWELMNLETEKYNKVLRINKEYAYHWDISSYKERLKIQRDSL